MPVERPLLYYQQITGPERFPDRTFGVQVLILDTNGHIWVQRDPDGGRIEAHARLGELPTFPNTRKERFNAVSGGMKQGETPLATALREMRRELENSALGTGILRLRDDLPLFMCSQEKGNHAYLFAGILVEYHPTPPEFDVLTRIGRFWSRETLMRRLDTGTQEELFRPAFALGVELLDPTLSPGEIERLIIGYNRRVLAAVVTRTWSPHTHFKFPSFYRDFVEEEAAF